MKINLALGMLICGILASLLSYTQYHLGLNVEEQFQQGATFVIGILISIIAILLWVAAPGLVKVEIFKKTKKRAIDRLHYS